MKEMAEAEEVKFAAECADRVIGGGNLDEETLYRLADINSEAGRRAMVDGAKRISAAVSPRNFDLCSIVNARSGRCSENCKWCAQSGHYHTGCDAYDIVDTDEARRVARLNASQGIGRFSLVASGKAVHGKALRVMADILRTVREEDGIDTCASMGLLNADELKVLRDAGVHRYHCNLEAAPSFFPTLCTTHTQADKMATIEAAHALGMEVCSGGIIGMGETRRQRMELAIKLREARPVSIPINVLSPIPGTPLADVPLISEEEIIDAVAMFRYAHPRVHLRFAGGRARMSRKAQIEAMKAGINSAVAGDLLTTIGSTVAEDKQTVAEAGYNLPHD